MVKPKEEDKNKATYVAFFKFTTKNTKAVCQKKRDAYAHIKKLKLVVSLRDAPRKLRASRYMRHAAEHTSYDIFILIALYVIQAQSHAMSSTYSVGILCMRLEAPENSNKIMLK